MNRRWAGLLGELDYQEDATEKASTTTATDTNQDTNEGGDNLGWRMIRFVVWPIVPTGGLRVVCRVGRKMHIATLFKLRRRFASPTVTKILWVLPDFPPLLLVDARVQRVKIRWVPTDRLQPLWPDLVVLVGRQSVELSRQGGAGRHVLRVHHIEVEAAARGGPRHR